MPRWLERFLDRALKIRPGEAGKVGLMALYSACAIGAVIVGRTVRDALFLADRSKDDLPMMYIANAIAVAVLCDGKVAAQADPVPLSKQGDAKFAGKLALPENCGSPALVVRERYQGKIGGWLAGASQ